MVHAKDYGVPQNRPRVLIVGIRKDLYKLNDMLVDSLDAGLLPAPTNDFPDLKDVLSDLVDYKFKYGGSTTTYPHDYKSDWQKKIRKKRVGRKISKKGDKLTEHEYSNHSSIVQEKFSYMIANQGTIPKHLKTKKHQSVMEV